MTRFHQGFSGAFALVCLIGLTASTLAAETQGKLKGVFPDKREIIVADSAGKDMTFYLAKDGKVIINGAESKLADLLAGDVVVLTHELQGEKLVASQIQCKRD